jgi:Xaa-Pro dipeptidase
MSEKGLDWFISFTPENVYYMTGHDSPGYYFYTACVIGTSFAPVNVLRRIEATNTLWRSWSRRAAIYDDRDDPIATTLGLLLAGGLAGARVGLEAEAWFVSPKRYIQLVDGIERAGGVPVDASGLIEHLRVTKSAEEISHMRAAARAAEAGMIAAIGASRAGTDENAVAAATVAALAGAGGEYAGLPPFITSGPRTSLCHSTWAGRQYLEGDVLNYELPGVVRRYGAALFRSGTVGAPDKEIRHRGEAVVESLNAVISAMRPGVTSHDVHMAGQQVFQRHGYGHMRGHRTGYSIGVNYAPDWGEGHIMSLWEGDERPLRSGMTFHLVPGLWDWGKSLISVSETVLVTETGCEAITNFPQEMFVA